MGLTGADVGELIALIALTVLLAIAGYTTMLVSETTLYGFAHAESFAFEPGSYNLRSAKRPHLLRGSYEGHYVMISYGLFDYFSEAGDAGISTIAYDVPLHPKVHFKMRASFPVGKRQFRTGDPAFDLWVSVQGGPKPFIQSILSDRELRRALKDTVSPTFSFTSTLSLTRAGPLMLRHKSVFLGRDRILRDLHLMKIVADSLEEYVSSSDSPAAAE